MSEPLLELRGVSAAYGHVQALRGVDLWVGDGEAVGLVGSNGAGKSTTLRAISGLVQPTAGVIRFAGQGLNGLPAHRIAELGIAHVPEGRRVFPEMTVRENLEIGAYLPRAKARRAQSMERVLTIFPRLAERQRQLAGTLSGGEQQMLAVGRGLMLCPRLLMLDEPSLGLAPIVASETFDCIEEIHRQGVAILLVEQNVARALDLVDRAYVLENGHMVLEGPSTDLRDNQQVRSAYLGL